MEETIVQSIDETVAHEKIDQINSRQLKTPTTEAEAHQQIDPTVSTEADQHQTKVIANCKTQTSDSNKIGRPMQMYIPNTKIRQVTTFRNQPQVSIMCLAICRRMGPTKYDSKKYKMN